MTQRIVLVGAPDTNKTKLMWLIAEANPHLIKQKPVDHERESAVGLLADYRTEIQIALDRVWFTELNEMSIATHSLIDSAAYSMLKYIIAFDVNASETTLQSSLLASNVTVLFLRDTFRADLIAFLPSDDTEHENINSALKDVIEIFDLPVIELSGNINQDANELIDLIAKG